MVRNWPDFFKFCQQYEFYIISYLLELWNWTRHTVSITALGEWVWNGHYLPIGCKQGDHRESVTKHRNDQHCQWHMCSVCGVRVWRICSVDVVYPLCLTSSAQQSAGSSDQCVGRIWWKLQSHNFILKIFFLACAYNVVLITDQFWIKWFFGKNVIFWPKNAFFGRKWLFDPLDRSGPQSCFRTFCSGANFLHSMKKLHWGTLGLKCQTNFSIFTHTFLAIFHQF